MKAISILKAQYISEYKVKLFFSDDTSRVIDFGNFLKKNSHPQYDKYKSVPDFKKFKLEFGNIVWGKDWDLIFPLHSLYSGKI